MVPLKEAIDEKHRIAERMLFNQKMYKGELTAYQYATYLTQLLWIFSELEKNTLPHDSLNRVPALQGDLLELEQMTKIPTIETTQHYVNYLSTLSPEQQLPHVYLHYLALMFGGQMMKEKVPGSGRLYVFENPKDAIMSIRSIQRDEWADEVNKALDYFIDILDELQHVFKFTS